MEKFLRYLRSSAICDFGSRMVTHSLSCVTSSATQSLMPLNQGRRVLAVRLSMSPLVAHELGELAYPSIFSRPKDAMDLEAPVMWLEEQHAV